MLAWFPGYCVKSSGNPDADAKEHCNAIAPSCQTMARVQRGPESTNKSKPGFSKKDHGVLHAAFPYSPGLCASASN